MTEARGLTAKRDSRVVAIPVRPVEPVVLASFSTRLPPELRIGELAAAALDAYLRERGF